ncbi:MAG: MATE family efflux transporter [Cyanobacteria bacterium J06643_13]
MTFKYSPIYRESKKLLSLAIPLASAQLAQALTGFFDTLMMGRLGASTLAAGGLAAITFMTLITVTGAVVMAVTPLIAEADGAGKKHLVAKITTQGFWLVVLATIPIALIVAQIDRLLIAIGQEPNTVMLANTYLDIMVWGCFPALGFLLLRAVVSGLSQTRPIMNIVVGGTVFNIVGNYVLAFGKLSFPKLGIAGLAIASVITFWGMFGALVIYILRHPQLKNYGLFSQLSLFELKLFRKLIRLGTPIGMFIALESGLFAVVTYLMGALGTEVLAAHQIVLQTIVMIFMIPLGISYATTIRVGQGLGKEDLVTVQQAAYLSIILGLLFNLVVAIAICLFPQLIIGLYLDLHNPANLPVIELATPMLTIGVIALILDGMQKIVYGALQGIQDTQVPVLLSVPSFWIIGLGTGYILGFYYDLGGIGLWIGQSLGLAIAAILFLIRFVVVVNRLKGG